MGCEDLTRLRDQDCAWLSRLALVIAVPRAAQVCFIVAAVISLLNRAAFPDLIIWDIISIALSPTSCYGSREFEKWKT